MGGVPPLGYAVRDRSSDHRRARGRDRASHLPPLCRARLGRLLQQELEAHGITGKTPDQRLGPQLGRPADRPRRALPDLAQPDLSRRDRPPGPDYPGEHAAIIDPALWDAVQARLTDNAVERGGGIRVKNPSLLGGLLFDSEGQRMTPTHAVKPCLDVLARRADVVARRQQLDKDRSAVRTGPVLCPRLGSTSGVMSLCGMARPLQAGPTGCEQCAPDPMAASSGRRLDLHQRGAALSGSNIVRDDADGSRRPLMAAKDHVRWFEDIRLQDVPVVGGKTASLGELRALLGDRVPEGFALTAQAYRTALVEAAGRGGTSSAALGLRSSRCGAACRARRRRSPSRV